MDAVRNSKTLHPLDDLAILQVKDLKLGALLASKKHPAVFAVDRKMVEVTGVAWKVDRARELQRCRPCRALRVVGTGRFSRTGSKRQERATQDQEFTNGHQNLQAD